jgi:hypothetical protein
MLLVRLLLLVVLLLKRVRTMAWKLFQERLLRLTLTLVQEPEQHGMLLA